MNSTQAAAHNAAFPFTVAPCDLTRAFPVRSFPTLELAREYITTIGGRPWVIALASGCVVDAAR